MTGVVVSLRLARKARARADAARLADANRAAHGRTKADKQAAAGEAKRRQALLDGAKLLGGELGDRDD